mgnify:CR=1 FL=1
MKKRLAGLITASAVAVSLAGCQASQAPVSTDTQASSQEETQASESGSRRRPFRFHHALHLSA